MGLLLAHVADLLGAVACEAGAAADSRRLPGESVFSRLARSAVSSRGQRSAGVSPTKNVTMNGLPAALNCFCARASLARTGALMAAACTFDTTHDADGGRVPHLPSSAGDAAAANAMGQKRVDMHSATQFQNGYRHRTWPHGSRVYLKLTPDLTDTHTVAALCPDTCATWRPPSDTWRWGQTHGHMASHKYEIASLHVHTMRPRSTPLAAAASHPRSSRLASDLGAISVRSRCDLGAASRATSVLPRCDHRPPLAAPRARPSRGTRGSPRAP